MTNAPTPAGMADFEAARSRLLKEFHKTRLTRDLMVNCDDLHTILQAAQPSAGEWVFVPRAELESISRVDASIASACEVRQWAIQTLAALAPVSAEVGCAEPQVGRAVYERIEKLIGATPGSAQARELAYLKHLTESVEELGGFDGPVFGLPPHGLVDHFKSMQRMATAYLMPEGYTDNTGASASAKDREARDELFISDMIYMLDGPEERAALRTEPTGGGEV